MILFILWLTVMTEVHHTLVLSAINHQPRAKTSPWFQKEAAAFRVETETTDFYFSSWKLLSSFTAQHTELLCFSVETGGFLITLLCFPVFSLSLPLFYPLSSRSHLWQVWQTVNSGSGPARPVWTGWLILVRPHSDDTYSASTRSSVCSEQETLILDTYQQAKRCTVGLLATKQSVHVMWAVHGFFGSGFT